MRDDMNKKLFRGRALLFLLCALALIVSVLVTALVLRNDEPQQQRYSYEEVSSWPPAHLAPGEKVPIIWQASPLRATTGQDGPSSITLMVLLMSEGEFEKGVCGAYQGAIRLDKILADETSGQDYHHVIQIPNHQRTGVYELVRQITKGQVSSCLAKRLVISPS